MKTINYEYEIRNGNLNLYQRGESHGSGMSALMYPSEEDVLVFKSRVERGKSLERSLHRAISQIIFDPSSEVYFNVEARNINNGQTIKGVYDNQKDKIIVK